MPLLLHHTGSNASHRTTHGSGSRANSTPYGSTSLSDSAPGGNTSLTDGMTREDTCLADSTSRSNTSLTNSTPRGNTSLADGTTRSNTCLTNSTAYSYGTRTNGTPYSTRRTSYGNSCCTYGIGRVSCQLEGRLHQAFEVIHQSEVEGTGEVGFSCLVAVEESARHPIEVLCQECREVLAKTVIELQTAIESESRGAVTDGPNRPRIGADIPATVGVDAPQQVAGSKPVAGRKDIAFLTVLHQLAVIEDVGHILA